MGTYKIREDVAVADIAFEVIGDTLEDLFETCALATMKTMVNIKTVGKDYIHEINLENEDIEKLLYDFIEEIIYLKDKDAVVFSECNVKIKDDKKYILKAEIKGEEINSKKQELEMDVKALTMHMFEVKKTEKGYKAFIVLDI